MFWMNYTCCSDHSYLVYTWALHSKKENFLKVQSNIQGFLFNSFESCHRHPILEILKCKSDSNLLNEINLIVACWVRIAEDPRNLYTNYIQVFLRQVKVNPWQDYTIIFTKNSIVYKNNFEKTVSMRVSKLHVKTNYMNPNGHLFFKLKLRNENFPSNLNLFSSRKND